MYELPSLNQVKKGQKFLKMLCALLAIFIAIWLYCTGSVATTLTDLANQAPCKLSDKPCICLSYKKKRVHKTRIYGENTRMKRVIDLRMLS